jgi:hypothetical protein
MGVRITLLSGNTAAACKALPQAQALAGSGGDSLIRDADCAHFIFEIDASCDLASGKPFSINGYVRCSADVQTQRGKLRNTRSAFKKYLTVQNDSAFCRLCSGLVDVSPKLQTRPENKAQP